MNRNFESIFKSIFDDECSFNIIENYTETTVQNFSYSAYKKRIYGVANFIFESTPDYKENQWIALCSKNSPIWSSIFWGVLMAGYNLVIIDSKGSDEYINNILNNVNVEIFIADEKKSVNAKKSFLTNEVVAFGEENSKKFERTFSNKIALCTSGTTGTPKIYVHTGLQLFSQIENVIQRYKDLKELNFILSTSEKKIYSMFPNHHISALLSMIIYQYLHGTTVMIERESISTIMECFKKSKVQIAYSVPMIWDSMIKYILGKYHRVDVEIFKELTGCQLKFVIMGAAKANPETIKLLDEAGIFSSQAYGMTELGSLTSNIKHLVNDRTNGCVGTINNKFYDAKILSENFELLPEGEGELAVSGDIVFNSMLIGGKEVVPDFFQGKYFLTGDRVRIKNNELFVIGRTKDVIINSSGENIYPDEIENHFAFLKNSVTKFTVIGIEEKPCIVMNYNGDPTTLYSSVIEEMQLKNSELPLFKRLSEFYITNQNFPETSNGKIQKSELKLRILNQKNNEYVKYLIKRG